MEFFGAYQGRGEAPRTGQIEGMNKSDIRH